MFRILRKFRKNKDGVAGIEFAFLFPVFLTLTFFILETSWYYTRVIMFDNSVRTLTKDIYIGAVATGGFTATQLEQRICDEFFLSGDNCTTNLVLELTEVTDFTDLPNDEADCVAFDATGNAIRPLVDFEVGGGSSVIFLRACYATDFFFPGLEFALGVGTEDERHNIISSTAFINEPT